jgi:hypothetical protein
MISVIMMTEYSNERIIGHHVSAEDTGGALDNDVYERYDISPMWEHIEITEGDVDWEDTRSVKITKGELAEMAEVFLDDD